jgi:hypothetical protein
VELALGARASALPDPQAALRRQWGMLRRRAGWRSLSLDWADPAAQRAPHYYEDVDGWQGASGAVPELAADESEGFPVRRALGQGARTPLSRGQEDA